MSSISNSPSNQSYKSSILLGIAGIASVGVITTLLYRSYIHLAKSRLMKTLRQDCAFHPFHHISATSDELSEIATAPLQKDFVRACISSRKPFQDPTLPLPVTKTINRLAGEIMAGANASSIEMRLDNGGDVLVGWHIDNRSDITPAISNVRFVCTLRGPTTRFAQLPFDKRCLFKNLTDKHSPTTHRHNEAQVKALITQEVGIGPENTFSPKIGQVIAFCNEDPNGAVHAGPLSRDPKRILVIFDLPR